MESIKIKNTNLFLNQSIQVSLNAREIRYSGIRKNCQVPDKWINGTFKSHWIYSFIYLDTGAVIEFEFDYENKYLRKL